MPHRALLARTLLRSPRLAAAALIASVTASLISWAVASPIGASPDDDFHLVSAWCASTSRATCEEGSSEQTRTVPSALVSVACFAFDPEASASCQGTSLSDGGDSSLVTARGNFDGTYPPLFYDASGVLASNNLVASAMGMRVLNLALFVGLASAASILMPRTRRVAAHLAWLITAVPLTMFLLASNNPSGWAITGIAVALPSLWGAIESTGRRRCALLAITLVAGLMAVGSRADAAAYVVAGLFSIWALAGLRLRTTPWPVFVTLGVVSVSALLVLATTRQVADATGGLADASEDSAGGLGLLGYNVLHLPTLWAGGFGATGLGWLDTALPPLVTWASAASFIAVMFVAMRSMTRAQCVVLAGVGTALIALPLALLQRSGDVVGANVQPRYLWPLIVAAAIIVLVRKDGRLPTFGRLQVGLLGCAIAGAHSVALYTTMRRFITGTDSRAASLNVGIEWWWDDIGSPMLWWAVGSVSFAVATIIVFQSVVAAPRKPALAPAPSDSASTARESRLD